MQELSSSLRLERFSHRHAAIGKLAFDLAFDGLDNSGDVPL